MIYEIKNLGCANCAAKIEEKINDLDEVDEAVIDFSTSKLHLRSEYDKDPELLGEINGIIGSVEDGAYLVYGKEEVEEEEKDKRFELISLFTPIVILIASFFIKTENVKIGLLVLAYVISGGGIVMSAVKNISNGQVFDENFLMTVASIGAMMIGEFSEAVAVMVFFSVGEYLQDRAVDRSRESITELMDIKAEYAHLKKGDQLIKVDPEELKVGDVILIKPGERVPVDGVIKKGISSMDTSALTGESMPRDVKEGDNVDSGSINMSQAIEVQVLAAYQDSQVARILDLVEESGAKKAPTEKFITRFSRVYTPIVCFLALALAVLPPLILKEDFSTWVYRALVFLVVSCPCALVVSIPLGFFAGIGRLSKDGVIAKGANHLEDLSHVTRMGFDKTGTLTQGEFVVASVNPVASVTEDELLKAAAMAESMSNHPIGRSIISAYGKETPKIDNIEDVSGQGIIATYEGNKIYAGNKKLMANNSIPYVESSDVGTIVYVGVNGDYYGSILIKDKVKDESKQVIDELHALGLETLMLTGDNEGVAGEVARELGIDEYKASLLPGDKLRIIESYHSKSEKDGKVAFVGDGINDAPVLIGSDVGIAMGQIGSDAAIEAADIIVMEDDLRTLPKAIGLSRKTMSIVKQNIVLALGIKFLVLVLGALGYASMWMAVFADTGVALLAILNSVRLLYAKAPKTTKE